MNGPANSTAPLTLRELLDISAFQYLTDSFTRLTGISTAILDVRGEVLTASGWQTICSEFHRKNPAASARCLESDTILAGKAAQGEQYHAYRCRNGLVDMAVPIYIEGTHTGNLFLGQFLFEPPNVEFFIQQAEEFGFDRDLYLDALARVPIFSAEQIDHAIDFLSKLTVIIGNTGLDKKRLFELNRHLEQRIEERTAELTYSHERLRVLSEASFEGIMISEYGVIVDANTTLAAMFGFRQTTDLIGMRVANLIAPDSREDVKKKVLSGYEERYEALGLKKDETIFPIEVHGKTFSYRGRQARGTSFRDLTEQRRAEREIKTLRGILPLCSSCKKIRNDEGYWEQIESYIRDHSEADFSHGLCPDCAERLYPGFYVKK